MPLTQRIEEQALGVSREQAAENRRAIVAAATQLFRERGVEAVGLNELMKHAGFTQGGFYNHFESKAALVAEVLASAMLRVLPNSPRAHGHPSMNQPPLCSATYAGICRKPIATTSIAAARSPDLPAMLLAWAPQ